MRAASHVPSASTSKHVSGAAPRNSSSCASRVMAAVSTVRHVAGRSRTCSIKRARHSASSGSPAAVATYVTWHPLSCARRTPNALFPERTGPVMNTTAIVRLFDSKRLVAPLRRSFEPIMVLNVLLIAIGVWFVAITLSDIFQVVIMPRATARRYRISFYAWSFMWYVWPKAAWRLFPDDSNRREDFLAVYAPFMLILMIGLWVALLTFSFGLIFWGPHSSRSALATSSDTPPVRDSSHSSPRLPGFRWFR